MKTIIPILAMMLLAGCGQNSTDQSNSTNSTASAPPAISDNTNNNMPVNGMTNAPVVSTNQPTTTNQ